MYVTTKYNGKEGVVETSPKFSPWIISNRIWYAKLNFKQTIELTNIFGFLVLSSNLNCYYEEEASATNTIVVVVRVKFKVKGHVFDLSSFECMKVTALLVRHNW